MENLDYINSDPVEPTTEYITEHETMTGLSGIKYLYPDGTDYANYYTYTKPNGVIVHFNKHTKESFIENPDVAREAGDIPEEFDKEENLLISLGKEYIDYDIDMTDHEISSSFNLKEVLSLEGHIEYIQKYLEVNNLAHMFLKNFEDNYNILIVSPPNTGKTSKVKDLLKMDSQKFIFLVPSTLQVDQMGSDDPEILALKGGSDLSSSQIREHRFIVTTYEFFSLKLDKMIKNKWEYYLIIDEFHKIISDSGYRNAALAYIFDHMFLYKRFVGLTGTAFGCINYNLLLKNVTLYYIRPKIVTKLIHGRYNIIQYHSNAIENVYTKVHPDLSFFYNNIRENISEGINIVFANNKNLLNDIKNKLLMDGIIRTGMFIMVNSAEKKNPAIQRMIRDSEVSKEKRILFTTSVLATGINLNGPDFKNIFVCGEPNIVEIVQLLYRFRQGIQNVFDFIPYSRVSGQIFNFKTEVATHISHYRGITESMNRIYHSSYSIVKSNRLDNIIEEDLVYLKDNRVVVNENRVQWEVLSRLHDIAFSNPGLRVEYLKLYGLWPEVKYTSAKQQDSFSIKELSKFSKKILAGYKKVTIDVISKNVNEALSYFKLKNLVHPHLFNNNFVGPFRLQSKTLDEYDKIFEDCLFNPMVIATVSDFLFFYGMGISVEMSLKLVNKNANQKITKAIEFLRMLPLTHKTKSEAQKLYKEWVWNHICFVREVSNYLISHPEIEDFKELKEVIAYMNKPAELINHFKITTMSKLKMVYTIKRQPKKDIYKIGPSHSAKDIFEMNEIVPHTNDITNLDKYLNSADPKLWLSQLYETK